MDVTTKLRLAFEVFDYNEKGTISRHDMELVIGGE
jgi:Ca2+-binding EF-hand superfamily protein